MQGQSNWSRDWSDSTEKRCWTTGLFALKKCRDMYTIILTVKEIIGGSLSFSLYLFVCLSLFQWNWEIGIAGETMGKVICNYSFLSVYSALNITGAKSIKSSSSKHDIYLFFQPGLPIRNLLEHIILYSWRDDIVYEHICLYLSDSFNINFILKLIFKHCFIHWLHYIIHCPETLFEGDGWFKNMKHKQTNK